MRGYGPGRFVQWKGGAASVRRRRPLQDRDALPARRLRDVRGLPREALQPGDARGHYKGRSSRGRAQMRWRMRSPPGRDPADPAQARDPVGVGLGYIHLGQSATTLSGGEAQRSSWLGALPRGDRPHVYLLDEPTGAPLRGRAAAPGRSRPPVDRGNTSVVTSTTRRDGAGRLDPGPRPGRGRRGGRVVAEGPRKPWPPRASRRRARRSGRISNPGGACGPGAAAPGAFPGGDGFTRSPAGCLRYSFSPATHETRRGCSIPPPRSGAPLSSTHVAPGSQDGPVRGA